MHQLHALHNAVLPDWPDPDPAPFRPLSFADFSGVLARLALRPADMLAALDGKRFVGYCITAFGTAVHPAYRGCGIGTALKAFAVRTAQHSGVPRLFTCTASPAMRHINEKLGYRLVRTEVRLVRRV